jgi:hypothetical protein
VPVYNTGTALDHRPYIAMMYYPKPSLAERARTERFSVSETLQLGIQLGAAVETAHRAGLLHRDIKPANVLTSAYGRPGLADFGIAGDLAQADDADVGVSVPWSPPETLYATSPATVRSDVYSLAATLWHLLVGRSPFEIPGGDNAPFALMKRIRDVPPPSTGRADVPGSLDRLLRAAMGKDPALRPATALEFVRAMQAIEQEQRFQRTPLELAEAETPDLASRRSPGADRTQVRSPQVISPVTGQPAQTVPPAAPADDAIYDATRRSNRRVAPVAAFDAGVEGHTVLRPAKQGAVQPDPVPIPPTNTGRRLLAIGLGVLVLAVIGAIVWAVATTAVPARPDPSPSVTQAPPDIDAPVPAPGAPVITCTRQASTVTCEWTYSNALPNDQFDWRLAGTAQTNSTSKPSAVITNAPAGVCIEVKVFRFSGQDVPATWTKGCEK